MIYIKVSENGTMHTFDCTVSDSVRYETVKFDFPKSWDGYTKTAVFRNGDITLSVILNSDSDLCTGTDECYIPHEVIKFPEFTVSVFGILGDSRATTPQAAIRVIKSGYGEGDEPSDPTPTEYQQLVNLANETKEIAQSVRTDADNGAFKGDPFTYSDFTPEQLASLKGKDGIDGKDGTNGTDGYTPQKGVDYFTDEDIAGLNIPSVDQTYTPTSENAQSGKAVAESINNNTATNLRNGSAIGSIRSINSKAEDSAYTIGTNATTEGYNTAASGITSHAEGMESQSGSKAFTIVGVNKTNKTYTLDSIEGLSIGDVYSAHVLYTTGNSSQAENHGKITAINENVVTVDNLWCEGEFATSDSYISGGYDGEKNTFRIIAKPNVGTRVIGDISHAEGVSTKALSKGSHAEGKGTIAHGSWSHAEGNNTKAAYNAHAEGQNTKAYGGISHAEGISSEASGYGSHAEGGNTKASGDASHAEGNNTKAIGGYSHAEGNNTKASGNQSHAEGDNTTALGNTSHAEGYKTIAEGNVSHAEGSGTTASGGVSHAEGGNTKAIGGYSHAEGNNTTASGNQSHAEGLGSKALGYNSHAEGNETIANSAHSHAEGDGTTTGASSQASHAEGYLTIANGAASHAEGANSKTDGYGSHAEGYETTASGYASHAEGYRTTANGEASHAEGYNTKASMLRSHAEGSETEASGENAHSEGKHSIASGYASHAEGRTTTASSDYQHVQGKYNIEDTNDIYADIIGNGSDDTHRSNAATVDWQGNAWYAGAVTSNGADYAEFFEWLDSNPSNEDRVGYLVALDGEKIRFANSEDEILGIISANPAILGDNYECNWNGKYLTDEFGRILYDKVEEFIDILKVDEETGETIIEKKSLGFFNHPRINPDYNPEQEYINRRNRLEWAMVGLFGKLLVRDDGTAQVNGYVGAGENGIATTSVEKTNMRVLSRVNDHIVKVLLK